MFSLLLEFSFAKWFFSEASIDDARHEFNALKFMHIDVFINNLLKKATTDAGFLTNEQKTQLEQMLHTDMLFDELDSLKRTQFSRMGRAASSNLDQNITNKLA